MFKRDENVTCHVFPALEAGSTGLTAPLKSPPTQIPSKIQQEDNLENQTLVITINFEKMAHDVYCALCAGPLRECEIAKKSRGSALRTAASEAVDDKKDNIDLEDQFRNDDAYWGYDPEIANEESSRWTSSLHVLGFNAGSEGTSKQVIPLLYDIRRFQFVIYKAANIKH